MGYIKLTHAYRNTELAINVDKIDGMETRFDEYTGEIRTLLLYGGERGSYVKESVDYIAGMTGGIVNYGGEPCKDVDTVEVDEEAEKEDE